MNKTIEIWSTYPPPYGGVSIHSKRLFESLKMKFELHFKNFNGKYSDKERNIQNIKFPIIELIKYLYKRNKIIHLHSNRLTVWLFVLFFPKSTNIIITIHNTRLKVKTIWFKYLIIKYFFKRAKYILLNDVEFATYLIKQYDIETKKIVIIPAFIPPLAEEIQNLPSEINEFFNKFDNVVSSFAWKLYKDINNRDVYGIDHVIEAFAIVKEKLNTVGLILVIPIIEDKTHFCSILKKIEKLKLTDSILIYNFPLSNAFDVWKKSNLFIRATTTDIEGISIKEALYFGTQVIATDVVERPTGVDLYQYGDYNKLSELIIKNLTHKHKIKYDNLIDGVSKIEDIYRLVSLQ